jgi:ribose/xylose/arabinose/galactoside ABC-type transport system permease subunit
MDRVEESGARPAAVARRLTGWRPSGPAAMGNGIVIGAGIVIIVLLAVFVDGFLTLGNLTNILVQTSGLGLLAVGLTFVLITGGIDLSLPAGMALAAVLGTTVMAHTNNAVLGVVTMLAVGMAVGLFNGIVVTRLGISAFIVTLATMYLARGALTWYTESQSVSGVTPGFLSAFAGKIGPIPDAIILLAVAAAVAHFVLSRTIYGRWIHALGINAHTARVSGMPTRRVSISVYIVAGFFAGVAALVLTARYEVAGPQMAKDWLLLDMITAAVIGGVSIYGGVGTVLGAILGAVLVTIVGSTLDLLMVNEFLMLLIKGALIVLALYLNILRVKWQRRVEK